MKKFLLHWKASLLIIFFILLCYVNGFSQQCFCYADRDGDGFGDPNLKRECFIGTCGDTVITPIGIKYATVSNDLDCNDNPAAGGAAINPNTIWYKDADGDGLPSIETLTQCTRPPGYKLSSEIWRGLPLECNGVIAVQTLSNTHFDLDDNLFDKVRIWYIDKDKDGFPGNTSIYIFSNTSPGSDYIYFTLYDDVTFCNVMQDCNDNDPLSNIDKEWYLDADGDGFPLNSTPEFTQCQKPFGAYKTRQELTSVNEDCNDQNAAIFPGTWYEDSDGDGLTTGNYIYACVQPTGYIFLPNGGGIIDCDDTDPDATISRDWYPDVDGDRHGNPAGFVQACKRPPGYFNFQELLSANDCNDNNAAVHPGAIEFCNGIDDDCDGLIDETYCCPTGNILYVNAANAGIQDGTSWVKAFKHLQDALEVARRCNNVEQIWVAGGIYYPDEGGIATGGVFQPRGGLAIYGGFTGTETLLSQRDLSSAASILSGEVQQDGISENNISNVVILDNISTSFVLDGFTIRDGYSSFVLPLNKSRGVGILVLNSTNAVQIRNCMFRNNVGNNGAAITNVSSMPEYINCVITGNTTMIGNGVIWNDNASPHFVNCSIANNAITGNDFIIIRNTGTAFPLIVNSIVRGTSPAMDGGSPLVFHSYIQNESVWPGIGNINNDPLFVDEANGNLHLQQGSPAINTGIHDLLPINNTIFNMELTDIESKNRNVGVIDMGAYESLYACSDPSQWVIDKDDDGYYPGEPVVACEAPGEGYVVKSDELPGDCNDNDKTINPTTTWYIDNDHDGYYNTAVIYAPSCTPPGPSFNTTSTKGPDCNDNDAAINPETIWYIDNDHDGYYNTAVIYAPSCTPPGPSFNTTSTKGPDCNDNDAAINPESIWYKDADDDGYTNGATQTGCERPLGGYKLARELLGLYPTFWDCNDFNTAIHPGGLACCDPEALAFTGSYADVNLTCNPANPDGSLGTATATDANGAVTVTSTDGTVVSDGCNRSKTRTFTTTDGCGNTTSTSRTVRWKVDLTPPTLTPVGTTLTLGLNPSASDIEAALGTATATDACGNTTVTSSNGSMTGTCSRSQTRTFTAKDGCGNIATAARTVTWTSDATPPTVLTKNITAQITQGGDAIITAAQVDNGSHDACGGVTLSLSKYTFYCENIGPNTVTLTATDANGNTASATATVTVEDHFPPTMFTKNITVQLNAGGAVTISPSDVNNGSYDACSIINYSLSKSTFNCSNVGLNTVALKATDANGNTASANATVTVEDHVVPTMLTRNITVQLSAGGSVTITTTQVNNGSFDACGIINYSLSKSIFNCSNVGPNTVILKATDANGNTATANATVTVEDKVAPIALAKNITAQITQGGDAVITAAQVDNGSNDACGSVTLNLNKYTFYCQNIGLNTVILTATDGSGNTSTATAIVTVEDHFPPTMLTKNITIQLNAGGTVTISPNDVNNGSYDACSIINYSLSKSTFNCSNIGPNTVTLKATDANGNTATAAATVTVADNLPPTVITRNVTINLNASGQASVTAMQVNNNSTDNCSIPSNGYLLSKTSFDCSNTGQNTVTLKVTDASGNTATANATVTVVDNLGPIANCKNITVYLGTNGLVNITGANLNNNSSDNCQSSLSFSVNRTSFNSDDLGSNCEKAFNVVLTATDGSGNSSTCSSTVTVKRRITKLVYNGVTEGQYSDPANLSATLYDITDGLPGVAIANKTVTFTLGAQSASDTYGGSGQGTNSSGIANGTLVLNQDPVPAYTIGISFAGDGVYCTSSASMSFDIKPEDLCSQYNGQLSVKASVLSKTNSSAKVVMSVGIADATDGNAGDVTKAKVEFNYGSGWITVPVQVLNAAKTIGNATYTATINFTGDGSTLNFNYRISGYYQINQECSDNGQSIINVYKPQGEFITGGGYIESTNRSVGIMPADEGGRANFGFNVKYNQKGTNLQGNISYIFRRKVNDVIRLYQVKGNSMTSLVVNMNDATEGGMKTAVFIGKCNVTDVTDPLSPVAVAGAGNNTMQVIITDVSETGVNDKYGITIWTPTNQVFHSSNWEGTKTTKLVLGGGDVVVGGTTSELLTRTDNTGTGSPTPEVDRPTTVEKTKRPGEDLKVTVMPNPSSANFRIVVNSSDLKEPVKLLVTDMLGRVVETRMTNAGQTITIGDKYISGTYAVRILQGRKIKQLTLIKLSD